MDAEAEGHVLARPGSVDDVGVRVLDHRVIPIARDVPHGHLVALADGLALHLEVLGRRPRHMRQRRLPTDGLRDHGGDQVRVRPQLGVLVGVLVERQDRAGDGVPRRVVAADDQQGDIGVEVGHRHVPRLLPMGQHGDEVAGGLGVDTFVPQAGEEAETVGHGLAQFGQVGHRPMPRRRGHGVGPEGQLAPLLEGEVEQGRERHGGELFRDLVHPVELLADRQAVEDQAGPLADQRRHDRERHGRQGRADGLALHVMARRVHGDEVGPGLRIRVAKPLGGLGRQGDALGRGKHLVVGIHRQDVVVAGDRPVGAVVAVGRVVDRRLLPQTLEGRPHGVVAKQRGPRRVKLLDRRLVGDLARLSPLVAQHVHISIGHSRSPALGGRRLFPAPRPNVSNPHGAQPNTVHQGKCGAAGSGHPRPWPPMGVVSASVSMPAISGRPLAMAAWTEGSDREARWASWLAQASVIHRTSRSAGSAATT